MEAGPDLSLDCGAKIHAAASSVAGKAVKAIEHLLAGGDTLAAARLINWHAPTLVAAGRLQTVRRWLDALGQDGLVRYPPLAITAAWILALIGDMPGAQSCLHAAERGSFDGPLPDARH